VFDFGEVFGPMNIKLTLAVLLICTMPGLSEGVIFEEIIAKVNDDIITRTEFEGALKTAHEQLSLEGLGGGDRSTRREDVERDTLRNLIDERLLIQRGNTLGLSVEAQVLRQRDGIMRQYGLNTVEEFENFATERMNLPVEDLMDQLRDKVLSQGVIGQEVGSKLVIPQADIEKYYEEHKDEFVRSEGIRLREILITADGKTVQELPKAEIRAKEVLGRVKKGEVFAEIARRFSDNTASAPNGGDIGIFRRGQLKAEIENEVFSQDQGYITDLIEVPGGYLILKVEELELKEVEAEIRGRLAEPLWDPALRTYLSDLRSDAYIEIRPGYVDAGAVAGMDTSWNDPAELSPVTTTKENVLQRKKKRRFLGIPLPGLPGRTRPSPATSGESDDSTDGP
jgi:peptidyl-prolyl cis-trans isomerase SurA